MKIFLKSQIWLTFHLSNLAVLRILHDFNSEHCKNILKILSLKYSRDKLPS